ncbi:adenylate kinase [Nakamurella aerolata]|uniref:Adenylate kinase n=1 Tax=Nakamurella aerolata TaxID=1656892 RepID=A0A849AED9_9ACTN|nr:adenylate kinase [Nakamurella aerolata]NNG35222.1 adenylate kinase [Nakamurella aerolata]
MRAMIIGPQGAGKGTQATRICGELGIPHISTGDLFRANIAGGTELGKLAQSYTDAGKLVPDDVTQAMVADRLAQPDTDNGFLLDGFPRNLKQAEWLSTLLAERGTPIERVLLLTAPDEVLMERMLARGRADDTEEAIQQRLDIYHAETLPLVEYYGDRVVQIDGVGEVDDVHDRIAAALDGTGPDPQPATTDAVGG